MIKPKGGKKDIKASKNFAAPQIQQPLNKPEML